MAASFLTVVHGIHRTKVPVGPGTLLSQVRDQACASTGPGLNPAEYTLSRQGKPLDLTLPFRFANLVNNAQVELTRQPQNTATAPGRGLRVKIRIPGRQDFLGAYPSDTLVSAILADAKLNGELMLGPAVVSPSATLASLGGGSGGLLFNFSPRAMPRSSPGRKLSSPSSWFDRDPRGGSQLGLPQQFQSQAPVQPRPEARQQQPLMRPPPLNTGSDQAPALRQQPAANAPLTNIGAAVRATQPQPAPHSEPPQLQPHGTTAQPIDAMQQSTEGVTEGSMGQSVEHAAEQPAEQAVLTPESLPPPGERALPINSPNAAADGDLASEPSAQQFLSYYKHIQAQSEPPLLSKSTAKRLRDEKHAQTQMDTLVIRVRFPDQTLLEGKFGPKERGADVYEFVRSYLREQHAFELLSVKPDFVVSPDAALVDDCRFGSRTLLYFIWKEDVAQTGPILTDKALALIGKTAAPVGPSTPASAPPPPASDALASPAPSDDSKKLKKKLMPKWLKLHK